MIENVFMRKVTVGRVAEAVLTIDLLYEEGPKGDFPPIVRNISLEQVTSTASPRVMFIRGFPGATIDGIKFTDCTFKGIDDHRGPRRRRHRHAQERHHRAGEEIQGAQFASASGFDSRAHSRLELTLTDRIS